MVMKFLLGIMHPRRLNYFLASLKKIDYIDVLLIKNMDLKPAMQTMKKEFLKRDYDYLIFTCDDIVIPYLAPAKIMQDVEILKHEVISGWSRINPKTNLANISQKELTRDMRITQKDYGFFTIDQITDYLLKGTYIIPVWFVGWSLTAMSRRVVKNWTPIGWSQTRGRAIRADLWFSYEMAMKSIKCFADLTVHIPHYPTSRDPRYFKVKIEPQEVKFIKAKRKL